MSAGPPPHGIVPMGLLPSQPPPLPSLPPWAWKTSCNLCRVVCSSPGALEQHMKSHSDWLQEHNSPKPLMARLALKPLMARLALKPLMA